MAATTSLLEFIMPIALFALTLSAFAIGTTEFVIVGLIRLWQATLQYPYLPLAYWLAYMRLAWQLELPS